MAIEKPLATVWCVQCPTIGGGEEDRRIRKEGKCMWRFFQLIYQAFFHKSPTTTSSKSFYLPPCLHGNHAAATRAHDVWQESLWSVLLCEMHLITNWQTNPVRHPCSVHCTYKVLHRTTLCSRGLLKFRDIFWFVDLGVEETTTIRFQLCNSKHGPWISHLIIT